MVCCSQAAYSTGEHNHALCGVAFTGIAIAICALKLTTQAYYCIVLLIILK